MHILALTNGTAGMRAQACGLAKQIAAASEDANTTATVAHQVVHTPAIAKIIPPHWTPLSLHVFSPPEPLSPTSTSGKPDIVVGCGTSAQSAVLALKKKHNAFAVCIQRPRGSEAAFDVIVAPEHDYEESETIPANTCATTGSVGLVNLELLSALRALAQEKFAHIPEPRTALLVGGGNRAFSLDAGVCKNLVESLLQNIKTGETAEGGILATASRRTSDAAAKALSYSLARPNCFFYSELITRGGNPYLDILAAADRFIVTGDSVNMISEACASARPVYIAALPETHPAAAEKFKRFHAKLQSKNCAQPWNGNFNEWTSPGLNETARAAAFVLEKYRAR